MDSGTNWQFQDCPIINPSEDHMSLLLLCDISGSMKSKVARQDKSRIDLLNEALAGFKDMMCSDPKTARTLDVAIVAFDHEYTVVQPFYPVSQMQFEPLQSKGGGTKIASAAQFAIDMLEDHVRQFTGMGVSLRKPWILMVTDGMPEHDSPDELRAAAARIKTLDAAGKLRFWSFGVGEYDRDTLTQFSGAYAIDLEGYNFSAMIDWAQKSMRAISNAAPGQAANSAPIDPDNGMRQVVTLPA